MANVLEIMVRYSEACRLHAQKGEILDGPSENVKILYNPVEKFPSQNFLTICGLIFKA